MQHPNPGCFRIRAIASRTVAAAMALSFLAVLTAPNTVAAQQTDLLDYPDTSLRGFVSAEFQRPLDDCRAICADRTGCVGFEYSSHTNTCRIFAGIDSGQSAFGSTSGTRNRIPGYRDPANAVTWRYARFSGIDLWGGDLVSSGLEMYDAESCERECSMHSSCRAFTFNHARNRCFLKTGYQFAQTFSDGTSGLFYEARQSDADISLNTEWELYLDSDLPGNDLVELRAGSYLQCLHECEPDRRCSGFTYVHRPKPGRCFLKTGSGLFPVRNVNGRLGVTSAKKSYRTVSPDLVRSASPRQ